MFGRGITRIFYFLKVAGGILLGVALLSGMGRSDFVESEANQIAYMFVGGLTVFSAFCALVFENPQTDNKSGFFTYFKLFLIGETVSNGIMSWILYRFIEDPYSIVIVLLVYSVFGALAYQMLFRQLKWYYIYQALKES